MNTLDVIILVSSGLLAVWGLLRGAVSQIFTVLSFVCAFFAASHLHLKFAAALRPHFSKPEFAELFVYGLIFFVVLVVVRLLGALITKLVSAAKLGWVNRVLGALIGIVASLILSAVLVIGLRAFLTPESSLLKASAFAPFALQAGKVFYGLLPDNLRERLEKQEMKPALPAIPGLDEVQKGVEKAQKDVKKAGQALKNIVDFGNAAESSTSPEKR